MTRINLLVFLSCHSFFGWGQSLVGKYDTNNESHTNGRHYEELILAPDHSFKYFTSMEFIRISKEGAWSKNGDTLILTEGKLCCKEKMVVEEGHDNNIPKGKMRFSVANFEGEGINYHLVLTDKDSTRTIWSRTGSNEVKVNKLRKFYFIVNSLVVSPEYLPQNRRANYFKVKLAPERFFLNEKWLILKDGIIPIGWDNKYTSYHLRKR